MPYLIDGHNLIPKVPGIHLHDVDDEFQLIDLLKEYCRKTSTKAEVYFDHAPPGSRGMLRFGRVTAFFVRQGRTADDAIRLRLKNLGRSARNWTVVSSDREIIATVKESGARWISTSNFASQIHFRRSKQGRERGKEEDPQLSPESIDEWLKIFGNGDDER